MQSATLSVRISTTESRALRERARKEGVSQGTLVRRALRAFGVTTELEPDKTGYDVIKHIVGRNRGGGAGSVYESATSRRLRSVKTWLIDTGPLVALLVGDDRQHASQGHSSNRS